MACARCMRLCMHDGNGSWCVRERDSMSIEYARRMWYYQGINGVEAARLIEPRGQSAHEAERIRVTYVIYPCGPDAPQCHFAHAVASTSSRRGGAPPPHAPAPRRCTMNLSDASPAVIYIFEARTTARAECDTQHTCISRHTIGTDPDTSDPNSRHVCAARSRRCGYRRPHVA